MLVYSFGRNIEGQLGIPSIFGGICHNPTIVNELKGRLITRIYCGMKHTMVLFVMYLYVFYT